MERPGSRPRTPAKRSRRFIPKALAALAYRPCSGCLFLERHHEIGDGRWRRRGLLVFAKATASFRPEDSGGHFSEVSGHLIESLAHRGIGFHPRAEDVLSVVFLKRLFRDAEVLGDIVRLNMQADKLLTLRRCSSVGFSFARGMARPPQSACALPRPVRTCDRRLPVRLSCPSNPASV